MSWPDTLAARSRGDVEGFHSHNATRESIEAAETKAAKAKAPETAHSGPEPKSDIVADDDEADDETAAKTVKATKATKATKKA